MSWHKSQFCSQGLGMLQDSGLCVVGDKLNFIRYLSHFRCIHRGAAFSQMRTTTVRKLLPESWGFLCPVDTPDGEPCGLMNHMTAVCEIVTEMVPVTDIPPLLCSLGMFYWLDRLMKQSSFLPFCPANLSLGKVLQIPSLYTVNLRRWNQVKPVLCFCLAVSSALLTQTRQPFGECKVQCKCLLAVCCRVKMFT